MKLTLFPFILKTFGFETMTENMRAPGITSFILLVAMCTLSLFSFISSNMRVSSSLLSFDFKDKDAKTLAYFLFSIGYVFLLLHTAMRPALLEGGGEKGFGGFGNLTSIVYLGIIVYLYRLRNQKLTLDLTMICMGSLMLIISLLSNTKHELITFFIAIGLSVWAFKIKIQMKHIVIGLVAAIVLVFVFVPAIKKTRTLEFREATVAQKLELLLEEQQYEKRYVRGQTQYLPVNNPLIDRLDILTETNIIIDGVSRFGFVGYYPVYDAIPKVLPSFIVGKKNPAASSDMILWDIQYRNHGVITRMTPGFVASAYAANGQISFIPILILLLSVFLLPLILLFGNTISNNIWSVFIITKYGLFFTEKPVDALIAIILRDLPLTILQVFLVVMILKVLGRTLSIRGNLKIKFS